MLATPTYADELATQAQAILKTHCGECHGPRKRESDPRFDVTDYRYLTSPTRLVVSGDPAASRIMQRTVSGEMPPEGKPRLSQPEVATLISWIKAGAKPWNAPEPRAFIGPQYVSQAIGLDVLNSGREAAASFRYVSLVNLWNEGVPDDELEQVRRAVDRVANSAPPIVDATAAGRGDILPSEFKPATITLIDELGLVIRLNLDDYRWTPKHWRRILELYPYPDGLSHVRADWFCVAVTSAPLYYEFLGVPERELDFERKIGVDRRDTSLRAGITDSAVSSHDRLAIRREGRDGPHWKMLNVIDEKSVVASPMRFQQDYALHIFTLANGFPGYAIFDHENDLANGTRANDVDPRAETDPTRLGGTGNVEIAYKCMTCHSSVIQPNLRDVVRDGAARSELVERLFPPQDQLTRIVQQDKARFVNAVGPGEPLRPVIDRYNRPLDLTGATADAGLEQPNALAKLIENQSELQAMGLRPLLFGRTVTRRAWQNGPASRVAELLGR